MFLAGSEASGSDSLREYGPPKVVDLSQNLINQGLPDAVTEQSFATVPLIVEIVKEAAIEAIENTEGKYRISELLNIQILKLQQFTI